MLILPKFRDWSGIFTRARGTGLEPAGTPVPRFLRAMGDYTKTQSRDQRVDGWGGDIRGQQIPGVAQGQLLGIIPESYFKTPDWLQFAAEISGIQEVITQPLYAYKAYAAAGYTDTLFFDQNEGNATNTRWDTNLQGPGGSLPANQMEVVVAIGVVPMPDDADVFVANALGKAGIEWYDVLTNGRLEFFISNKEYLGVSPLWGLPTGFGPGTFTSSTAPSATAYSANFLNNGSPDNRARFHLDPPIGILPGRPFGARLKYATAEAVTTAGRMGVWLHGWQIRTVS